MSSISQWVDVAAGLIIAVGPATAAAMQLLKELYRLLTRRDMPSELNLILPAAISGGLTFFLMVAQGAPWTAALLSALVALYAPKVSYDAVRALRRDEN